ncbi:hypothetical protein ACFQZ4_31335 [Catellatospora coxensis]
MQAAAAGPFALPVDQAGDQPFQGGDPVAFGTGPRGGVPPRAAAGRFAVEAPGVAADGARDGYDDPCGVIRDDGVSPERRPRCHPYR